MLRWIVVGVVAVLVLGGTIAAFASGGGGGGDGNPVLITAKVIKRDLRDEATVTGTLGRVEERTVSASAASASGSGAGSTGLGGGGGGAAGLGGGATVSSVYVEDGGTVEAEKPILSLDGRDSITENGDVPFFRKLDVGSTGVDVAQLEQILQTTGYSPGKVDQLYTEQTRAALAQWQAAHSYPGDNPTTKQTLTVSLGQGAGYTIGKQSSAAATIGPYVPPARKASYHPTGGGTPAIDAFATAHVQAIPASMHAITPCGISTVSVSGSTTVKEGGSALITVSGDVAATCDQQVILTAGGDATPGVDYDSFSPTVTIPNGSSSTSFTLKTRTDLVAESPEHVLISPAPSASYSVGSSATVTITDGSVTPVVTLTEGSGIVPEGQVATFTAGLSQPLNVPLQIFLDYSGTAQNGEDYSPAAGALDLRPGHDVAPDHDPDRERRPRGARQDRYRPARPAEHLPRRRPRRR